jgi:hypothetical protein
MRAAETPAPAPPPAGGRGNVLDALLGRPAQRAPGRVRAWAKKLLGGEPAAGLHEAQQRGPAGSAPDHPD